MKNIGNKAKYLIMLKEKGLLVPDFEVFPFDVLIVNYLQIRNKIEKINSEFLAGNITLSMYESKTKTIKKHIKIDSSIVNQIYQTVRNKDWTKISLRTSATDEDGRRASFAGQYQTFLDITPTKNNLKRYIRGCAISTFNERVLMYAKKHRLKKLHFAGSVIIQEMFYGTKSGVLFTEDGQGNASICVSNSWKNNIVNGEYSKIISIPKINKRNKNISNAYQRLLDDSARLEKFMGLPLDIEFSIKGQKVAFLQVRPKTNHDISYILEWDSTNISESYPNITLPLTYSYIKVLYAEVYQAFLKLIGTSNKKLSKNSYVFDNILGYFNGRVYYRISNWYELVKLIPGRRNQQYFELMLKPTKSRSLKVNAKFDIKSIGVAARFAGLLILSPLQSNKFKSEFNDRLQSISSHDFTKISASAITNHMKKIRAEMLKKWAIPILNDVRLMIFHGILRNIIMKKFDDKYYLELLQGLTDRASIKPLEELQLLGQKIHKLMRNNGLNTFNQLQDSKYWDSALELANNYIINYGARTPDELKLENIRISDSPETIIKLALKSKNEQISPTNTNVRISKYRLILRFVAWNTKSAIDWRERFRFNRAQIFDLTRKAYIEIGKRFVSENIISSENDIFWLTIDEIDNIIEGHSWDYDAKQLIIIRKKKYKQHENQNESRHITARGLIATVHPKSTDITKTNTPVGEGVSQGELAAKVIVATKFNQNLDVNNKILVVPHIDPGWTLLFTQAAGVITEKGNALSHVAIIARELGIPAIVKVDNATKLFKTGQKIRMNGTTGEIDV